MKELDVRLRRLVALLSATAMLCVAAGVRPAAGARPEPPLGSSGRPRAAAVPSRSPSEREGRESIEAATAADPLQASSSRRVIVRLKTPSRVGPETGLAPAALQRQRGEIVAAGDGLARELRGSGAAVARSYRTVPYAAVAGRPEAIARLRRSPYVAAVQPDRLVRASLGDSGPIVQAPEAWAAGADGTGQTIAVLDSGVQRNHPFLAGKVVDEACFATGLRYEAWWMILFPEYFQPTENPSCPNGQKTQSGTGSARPCGYDWGCFHGTHVAGIAAGAGTEFSGVAKGAHVVAVQVFSRFENYIGCSLLSPQYPCALAQTSDVLAGLEHVYDLRNTYRIASVNMSLGGGGALGYCDDDNPVKPVVDNLRAAGIATVVASGNDGAIGVSWPACTSSAVSVGATEKDDTVTDYSNVGVGLDLLAPGSEVKSSFPDLVFESVSGTSMATPHVAGAFAVLRQRFPSASVDELLSALRSTGKPARDVYTRITRRRIRVADALAALSAPNRAPVVVPDHTRVTGVDTPVRVTPLANDADVEGDAFTITSHSKPNQGEVDCDATACTYSTFADYATSDGFDYTVTDAAGNTAVGHVVVDVPGPDCDPDDNEGFELKASTGDATTTANVYRLGRVAQTSFDPAGPRAPATTGGVRDTVFRGAIALAQCGYHNATVVSRTPDTVVSRTPIGPGLDLRLTQAVSAGADEGVLTRTYAVTNRGGEARTLDVTRCNGNQFDPRWNATGAGASPDGRALYSYGGDDYLDGRERFTRYLVSEGSLAGGGAGAPAHWSVNEWAYRPGDDGIAPADDTAVLNDTNGDGVMDVRASFSLDQEWEPTIAPGATATLTLRTRLGVLAANPGLVQVAAAHRDVDENAGAVTLPVTRPGGSAGAVSVHYATADGTARAGEDYTPSAGDLAWAAGDMSTKTATVPVAVDATAEGPETFRLELSAATGAALGAAATTVTVDDTPPGDPPGEVGFADATVSVSEGDVGVATVTRAGGGAGAASVLYSTHAGTATETGLFPDYYGRQGRLAWSAGDATPRTLSVQTVSDSERDEGDESFGVTLSNARGAGLGAASEATFKVADATPPEAAGTVATVEDQPRVDEDAGVVTLQVVRAGGSQGAASVRYETFGMEAAAGEDYVPAAGVVAWADGDASPKTITIPIVDDAVDETDDEEFFNVFLWDAKGAAIESGAWWAVFVVDDDQAGRVQFTTSSASVDETAGTATLTVDRVEGDAGPASVEYATSNGSAQAGSDYRATSGTLSWADGDDAPRTITVPVLDDGTNEADETFKVALANPGHAALGAPTAATVTIRDDEPSTDTVALSVTGGYAYANSGVLASGNVVVAAAAGAIQSVTGSGTLPGASGGDATVSFNVNRLWVFPIYLGTVDVNDPGAGISLPTVVLFAPVTATSGPGATTATSTNTWFTFQSFQLKAYTLAWTVSDDGV